MNYELGCGVWGVGKLSYHPIIPKPCLLSPEY